MAEKCIREHFIDNFDVDVSSHLRPSSFLCMAQSIAAEQVVMLDCGATYFDLLKENKAWAISRAHFKFLKMPKVFDKYVFSSWHKRREKLFYLRDYKMESPDGEVLIVGTASWIVLDLEKRSVSYWDRMNEEHEIHDDAVEEAAPRLRMPRGVQAELAGEHIVKYSDVDTNFHANNTKYVDWAMDVLDYELTSTRQIKELTVNYNHEVRPGQAVQLYTALVEEDGRLCCFVDGRVEGVSSFCIELVY